MVCVVIKTQFIGLRIKKNVVFNIQEYHKRYVVVGIATTVNISTVLVVFRAAFICP